MRSHRPPTQARTNLKEFLSIYGVGTLVLTGLCLLFLRAIWNTLGLLVGF